MRFRMRVGAATCAHGKSRLPPARESRGRPLSVVTPRLREGSGHGSLRVLRPRCACATLRRRRRVLRARRGRSPCDGAGVLSSGFARARQSAGPRPCACNMISPRGSPPRDRSGARARATFPCGWRRIRVAAGQMPALSKDYRARPDLRLAASCRAGPLDPPSAAASCGAPPDAEGRGPVPRRARGRCRRAKLPRPTRPPRRRGRSRRGSCVQVRRRSEPDPRRVAGGAAAFPASRTRRARATAMQCGGN